MGEKQAALDDDDEVATFVEIKRVETLHFLDVPWEFAQVGGEGFESIEDCAKGSFVRAQRGTDVNERA